MNKSAKDLVRVISNLHDIFNSVVEDLSPEERIKFTRCLSDLNFIACNLLEETHLHYERSYGAEL